MKFEEAFRKGQIELQIDEKDIELTVNKAREIFLKEEDKLTLSFQEFLFQQFYMIKKRWWILQFAALCFLWGYILIETEKLFVFRSMGVFATLFVIFAIPELWKNLTYQCVEIEMASMYSLHKIYAARMVLFGITDVIIVSIFVGSTYAVLEMSLIELVIHFLLPLVVTAGICLEVLCKGNRNEKVAISLCLSFSVIWWEITRVNFIYTQISTSIWIAAFVAGCFFMIYSIYKIIKETRNYETYQIGGSV